MIKRVFSITFLILICFFLLAAVPADGTGTWATAPSGGEIDGISSYASVLAEFDLNDISEYINVGFTTDTLSEKLSITDEISPATFVYLTDSDGNGEAINDDVKFYYQIVSKTPISVYVDASGPMISTDENGNIVDKLGWDITSKNSAVEFSRLNIHDTDTDKEPKRIGFTHSPKGEDGSIGIAGYVNAEIKTNNDEGHTYLDKVPGDYFGYVYLRVVAEASGGNNAD